MTEADIAGLPTPFQWNGHTFQVCPRDLQMELLFANYVQAQAAQALRRHAQALGEQAHQDALARWTQDVAAGEYEFGSPVVHRALFSRDGLKQMLFFKLLKGMQQHQGAPVDRALIDKIAEDPKAFNELVAVMLRQDFPNQPAAPDAQSPPGA